MGARGTGKTYSSIGAFSNAQNNNSLFAEAKVSDGVAVRFIRDIFEKILQADETLEFTVCISVFEGSV